MQGAPSLSYSSFHRLCSNYVTVSNNLPHPVAREPGSFKDTIEPRPPPPRKEKIHPKSRTWDLFHNIPPVVDAIPRTRDHQDGS